MSSIPARREIVLLGAGHTHLHVLRMWRQAPIPHARLTCVSDFLASTYSGMLPGTLAGLYRPGEMRIDLVGLCEAAGARLIRAEVASLDRQRRELVCRDGPAIPYDLVSVGIGSAPRDEGVLLDENVLRIKPMQTFLARLRERLTSVNAPLPDVSPAAEKLAGDRPLRIAIVGGGAGGVEIAFCLPPHLRQVIGPRPFELSLFDSGHRLLTGMPRRAGKLAHREFTCRGVKLTLGQEVRSVHDGELTLADESRHSFDLVVWCTGAQPPPLLKQLGLTLDDAGFLLTRPTLQSVDDSNVFAVGDSGTIRGNSTPKAGVYAVRQGPILWGNLHRSAFGRPLIEYRPQSRFLSLLATGDCRAILSYRGLALHAGWCWQLKNSIDTRFVEQFRTM